MKISQVLLLTIVTVSAVSFVAGCGNKPDPKPTNQSGASDDHGHPHKEGEAHSHGAGPHDGTVADWGGGKYHVEFTVDHDKQEATVYVLGGDEKTPSPIKADEIQLSIKDPAMQVTLKAAPQDGDPEGSASRFVGNHESLGVVQEYEGTITGVIDDTPYSGNFKEEPHGHGSHVHGEDDALVWEGEPKMHAGFEIKLGHHGKHLHAGEEVEPAVSITRDGKPVSDAKVFNALVSADGETVLAKEVATVFEPTTEDEPAHYAQGALAIPKDAKKVIIRFRIAPAEGDEATFDLPIAVE